MFSSNKPKAEPVDLEFSKNPIEKAENAFYMKYLDKILDYVDDKPQKRKIADGREITVSREILSAELPKLTAAAQIVMSNRRTKLGERRFAYDMVTRYAQMTPSIAYELMGDQVLSPGVKTTMTEYMGMRQLGTPQGGEPPKE